MISPPKLYPTHIPTAGWEKFILAVGSGMKSLQDPLRADMVAAVGETTGHRALRRLRAVMLRDPTGRRILREQPVITSAILPSEKLAQLPRTTLGGAYYHEFMAKHGYSPDGRSPVHFVDDAELAYVMLRYRQVHDFWHALTGLPPTVLGELAQKALEFAQTGLPMALLGVGLGPVRLTAHEREVFNRELLPWAIRTGVMARPLMNVYYEELLSADLAELRRQLRISPAPEIPGLSLHSSDPEQPLPRSLKTEMDSQKYKD